MENRNRRSGIEPKRAAIRFGVAVQKRERIERQVFGGRFEDSRRAARVDRNTANRRGVDRNGALNFDIFAVESDRTPRKALVKRNRVAVLGVGDRFAQGR